MNELTGEIANDADDGPGADDDSLSAEMVAANEKLRKTSEVDAKREPTTPKPARQPALRKPLPENLERVANRIPVAPEQRPWPQCGGDRVCIGHDITEIAELRPPTVIVRSDAREKLKCEACEGAIVRAPVGDKVGVSRRSSGKVPVPAERRAIWRLLAPGHTCFAHGPVVSGRVSSES